MYLKNEEQQLDWAGARGRKRIIRELGRDKGVKVKSTWRKRVEKLETP
jgi:hypothetical protein